MSPKATMSRAEAVLLAVVPIALIGVVLIATLIGADLGVALAAAGTLGAHDRPGVGPAC